jgi:hypothetical protein
MDSRDKVAVVLTREQASHAIAMIEEATGSCPCCRDTVAALEAALKE